MQVLQKTVRVPHNWDASREEKKQKNLFHQLIKVRHEATNLKEFLFFLLLSKDTGTTYTIVLEPLSDKIT